GPPDRRFLPSNRGRGLPRRRGRCGVCDRSGGSLPPPGPPPHDRPPAPARGAPHAPQRPRPPRLRGGGRRARGDRELLRLEPPHLLHRPPPRGPSTLVHLPAVRLPRDPVPPGDDRLPRYGPAPSRSPRGPDDPPPDPALLRLSSDRWVRPRTSPFLGRPRRARRSPAARVDRQLESRARGRQQRLRLRLPPRPLARRTIDRVDADH